MASPPRPPHRISKRVLGRWEALVYVALRAEERRLSSLRNDNGTGNESTRSSYVVPQCLSQETNISAILQAADEIQLENPQVARILCEYAYSLSQELDPTSAGRGVLQFKTGLISVIKQKRLKKEGEKIDRSQDISLVQEYYRYYREKHRIDELEEQDRYRRQGRVFDEAPGALEERTEKMRRVYQISRILNDVVDALTREADPEEADRLLSKPLKKMMEEDAKKIREFKAYNILPLETPGVANAFTLFPEVACATRAFMYTGDLPKFPDDYMVPEERALDLFDFLHHTFGFQNDNVANQREHLILLLANSQSRFGVLAETEHNKLDDAAISDVHNRLLSNYNQWCHYIRKESMSTRAFTSQKRLFLTALYLLIWGEAANVRFMPECLCYIFHHMADELYDLLERPEVELSRTVVGGSECSFLEQIISPVYEIVAAEAKSSGNGIAAHSSWRNYDDFNEFFWAPSCFELGWPWHREAGFFMKPKRWWRKTEGVRYVPLQPVEDPPVEFGRKKDKKAGKTNFVEHRTAFHLYHSFHRLWMFFLCMLQGLTIFAFCGSNLHIRTIKFIMSVGPTFVIMKFLKSVFDVMLMVGAYRSTRARNVARMLLRFVWFTFLSVAIVFLYIKMIQEENHRPGSSTWFKIFYVFLASYAITQLFIALLLHIPWFRLQADKCSNFYVIQFIKWLHQERYYVGRGMYERTRDYFGYTLFWAVILGCKFTFSYFFQIKPMVEPTRIILGIKSIQYQWHDIISGSNHHALTLLSLWAPVIMDVLGLGYVWMFLYINVYDVKEGSNQRLAVQIYFVDTQVWYTVTTALIGGLDGASSRLGEIRSLQMLRKRFISFPEAFVSRMQPPRVGNQMSRSLSLSNPATKAKVDAIKFAPLWNDIICSLREEDLINNREKELLMMPDNRITYVNGVQNSLVQWPLFLLANKVYVAVDIALEHRNATQEELWERVKRDDYMAFAVQETFQTLEAVLLALLNEAGAEWVKSVYGDIKSALGDSSFAGFFDLNRLTGVLERTAVLSQVLVQEESPEQQRLAVRALQDLYEMVMHDFLSQDLRDKFEGWSVLQAARREGRLFTNLTWPVGDVQRNVTRLNYLLTIKDSALNIPRNLEARRRLQFFTNSLFMHMPEPPPIRKMFSFSVFTPYYSEDVMYSKDQLRTENEDGITILFYLQKIFPDEWRNFLERIRLREDELELQLEKDILDVQELRLWASYRGQTLARTVRGMMYYKRALILQASQEGASSTDIEEGLPLSLVHAQGTMVRSARAQAELKFTYVVTCQIYGQQKRARDIRAADISYLMQKNDSLRIAYIDVVETVNEGRISRAYFSKLVKADASGIDQEIYSIKLPGDVKLGEGKPENQNHAIIFTRGDAIQTIDMNQDNYLEETFKVRNLLEEFDKHHGLHRPSILGVREHVFTGSVSSLAWFMSMQESTFVTLGQRVLAHLLKVRMHYGHPDIFDRIFHISRGGISKASRVINISEDIYAGFNSTLRQGNITHHEYIQVGKGRDVGLNQIALFEAKVASGNGEQTLSRDVYRLGQFFDFFRMLSFFFTSVGFYVITMMTVLTVYVFLYGKAYLALSGVDKALKTYNNVLGNSALQSALDTQFLFQIGVFTAVPMIMNLILEEGLFRAAVSFCTMQLQLASVFFTFSLGTRTHYFGRTILHGGAKYRATGRGFVVRHISFAENYRLYSRSHFVKAMEIILLLIIYLAYGAQDRSAVSYILLTFSSWFLAVSWLFAPYIFNPSGYEWQKSVEDFDSWTSWLFYKGGIGVTSEISWEVWWAEEQEHIRSIRSRILELILSLRFFLFQYGIVYTLHVHGHDTSLLWYGYSWLVLVGLFLLFKIFTFSQKASANIQLVLRLFQGIVFLAFIAAVSIAVAVTTLTIKDVCALVLAFIPTGWGLLSIAIALRPAVEWVGLWDSVRDISRVYDACMGMVVFVPIAFLSWFPFVSTFQTRLVFNQAFSRGLEISLILAGNRPNVNL